MVELSDLEIRRNLEQVRENIARAARRVSRDPESIKLIAVSKTVAADRVQAALEAGIDCLGENRVQEGLEKRPLLSRFSFSFHLIGTLQKNKVNKAVPVFDWIDSVDSVELARKIDQACERAHKVMPVLLEVNLGEEGSKSGAAKDEIVQLAEQVAAFKHLSVRGLMTIPPFLEEPEAVRPYFRGLHELAAQIRVLQIPQLKMDELSMGMSHDYSVAIEEGATMVRIGTAIFGDRQYP